MDRSLKKGSNDAMLRSSFAVTPAISYSLQPETRSRWLSQLAYAIAFPTISASPRHRKDIKACAHWLARHLAELNTTAADGGDVSPLAKRAGNARQRGRKSKLMQSPVKSEAHAIA